MVKLVMGRGHPVTLRVTGINGSGIPGAEARVSGLYSEKGEEVFPEMTFRADDDGVIEWKNAPNLRFQFDAYSPGYVAAMSIPVAAGALEASAILVMPLKIHGRVTSQETGLPVRSFSVVIFDHAIPSDVQADEMRRPYDLGKNQRFYNGVFDLTLGDSGDGPEKNSGYILQIESEGFLPAKSRWIALEETNVALELALQRSRLERIRVLDPDGKPVSRAQLMAVAPDVRAYLSNGQIEAWQGDEGEIKLSDETGGVDLPANAGFKRIVAAAPGGFAGVDLVSVLNNKYIKLQPWGSIAGVCHFPRPTNGTLSLVLKDGETFGLRGDAYSTAEIGVDGHFDFPRIAPGTHGLFLKTTMNDSTGKGSLSFNRFLVDLNVIAGETIQAPPNLEGIVVRGRLVWEGVLPEVNPRGGRVELKQRLPRPIVSIIDHAKSYGVVPLKFSADEKALVDHAMDRRRRFSGKISDAGIVTVEGVLPGDYEMSVSLVNYPNGPVYAAGILSVTVPDEVRVGILEAGEVKLVKGENRSD